MLARIVQVPATVIFCGIAAVVIHELSHAIVYWIGGFSAWISFQRVHVGPDVPKSYELLANAAGPVGTWIAAAVFYKISQSRNTFFWRTMTFSNATLRIIPSMIAIARTLMRSEHGFSDEGFIAFALAHSVPGRLGLLLPMLSVSIVGTWFAGKTYRFDGWRKLWLFPIFLASYSMMFFAFMLDQWFGFNES
jgi:hypothetical protein